MATVQENAPDPVCNTQPGSVVSAFVCDGSMVNNPVASTEIIFLIVVLSLARPKKISPELIVLYVVPRNTSAGISAWPLSVFAVQILSATVSSNVPTKLQLFTMPSFVLKNKAP